MPTASSTSPYPWTGVVKFPNGTILFFESDGHLATAPSHLYETVQEVINKWNRGSYPACHCSREEVVSLFYGGTYWVAKACQYCYRFRLDPGPLRKGTASQRWAAELGDWTLINTDDGEHIFRIRSEEGDMDDEDIFEDNIWAEALAAFRAEVIAYAQQHGWEKTLAEYPNPEEVEVIYDELMNAPSGEDNSTLEPL